MFRPVGLVLMRAAEDPLQHVGLIEVLRGGKCGGCCLLCDYIKTQ